MLSWAWKMFYNLVLPADVSKTKVGEKRYRAEVGNILSWRLIMKYFVRSFSAFRWFKKGSYQFLAKECAQYWLTA